MFPFAPSPDIYRAAEKDDALLTRLRDDLTDVCLQWGGQRWSTRHAEVDLLSAAAFYGLTQLRGQPSLGEEYCDLRQVVSDTSPSLPSPAPLLPSPFSADPAGVGGVDGGVVGEVGDVAWPSARRRLALFTLQVLAPYVYSRARRHQQQMNPLPPPTPPSTLLARVQGWALTAWHRLLGLIPVVDGLLPHVHRLHLAVFFLTGRYLSLPKRLVGARYVALRVVDQQRPSYRGLGLLLLLQLTVVAAVKGSQGVQGAVQWWRQRGQSAEAGGEVIAAPPAPGALMRYEDDGGDEDAGARQCILHLGPVRDPTATECGHVSTTFHPLCGTEYPPLSHLSPSTLCRAANSQVFCWYCITECCKNKPECPLCRAPATLENLLHLAHYK